MQYRSLALPPQARVGSCAAIELVGGCYRPRTSVECPRQDLSEGMLGESTPGRFPPYLLDTDAQHGSKPRAGFYWHLTYELYQMWGTCQQAYAGTVSPHYL